MHGGPCFLWMDPNIVYVCVYTYPYIDKGFNLTIMESDTSVVESTITRKDLIGLALLSFLR